MASLLCSSQSQSLRPTAEVGQEPTIRSPLLCSRARCAATLVVQLGARRRVRLVPILPPWTAAVTTGPSLQSPRRRPTKRRHRACHGSRCPSLPTFCARRGCRSRAGQSIRTLHRQAPAPSSRRAAAHSIQHDGCHMRCPSKRVTLPTVRRICLCHAARRCTWAARSM